MSKTELEAAAGGSSNSLLQQLYAHQESQQGFYHLQQSLGTHQKQQLVRRITARIMKAVAQQLQSRRRVC